MTKVDYTERFMDFSVTKRFGKEWEYGQRIYGKTRYGEQENEWNAKEYGYKVYGKIMYGQDDKRWGIYQKRHEQGKTFYIRENFYTPLNPQSVPQQAWRDIFTDGMTAWSNLTDAQKLVYHNRAQRYHLHGVNLYLREYLNSKK